MHTMFDSPSVLVIDNFFDDFDYLEEAFKKEPLYDFENHPESEGRNPLEYWVGERSDSLIVSNPFLHSLFFQTASRKIVFNKDFEAGLYLHLRPEYTTKTDYCHQDACHSAVLVYLSKTNLESGTNFYDVENGNPLTTVKFVQNRAIFFSSKIWHSAFGAHGQDINDGRLTLNAFIYEHGHRSR